MVGLNPVLRFLMAIEEGVNRGDAIRDIVLQYVAQPATTRIERTLERQILGFLRSIEQTCESDHAMGDESGDEMSLYRQSLFSLLFVGVQGNSILPQLRELRSEIEAQLELDMKAHIESLPLKMLIPLLLGMFPAFLILLLGPITQNFLEALK